MDLEIKMKKMLLKVAYYDDEWDIITHEHYIDAYSIYAPTYTANTGEYLIIHPRNLCNLIIHTTNGFTIKYKRIKEYSIEEVEDE